MNQLLVSEIETKENAYIVFIFGFCLPTFICLYRSASILTGQSFLLPYYSFFFIDNCVYELIVFCYIPFLILLYFLRASNCSFFIRRMEESRIVSVVFCRMAEVECYFYDHRIHGIFFLIVYFLAYLYGLYKGSLLQFFFIFFRLLISYYFSFRLFFRVEYENIECTKFLHFSFFQTFYKFHEKLIYGKTPKDYTCFIFICALISLYLCRENRFIKFEIQNYEKICEKIIFSLEKQNTGINIQELYREKQDIFASGKRKVLFFYLAHQLYGGIKKKK